MAHTNSERRSRFFHASVTVAGISTWLAAVVFVCTGYGLRDQLIIAGLVPLVIVISMFPNSFPLPSGFKHDKITFTLSDAFVLLIACWYGMAPAVFVAGIEAFAASRRVVNRLSSNLFSFGMMSFAAAAAAFSLEAVLRYGFHEIGAGTNHSFFAVTVALMIASAVHLSVNVGLISMLFSLRRGTSFFHGLREDLFWVIPMFIPTHAVASLMYLVLQYNLLVMLMIGVPILIAIGFGHRQYRNNVQQQIDILEKAHRQTVEALAVAINAKDEVTHEHVLRVQIYAAGVARIMGCNEAEVEALRAGALLHDIGKIAVPDYILNKPGKLTAAEFEKMKKHTIFGAQILGRVAFSYPVVPIVRHHHERWDGAGYPDGLSGEDIPLTARILSVVDCFDAVREDRQYRKGMTREQAIDLIMQGSGKQYDPRVVGIFITHLPEFEAEILAHRNVPAPTFGIEPIEELSEAARNVAPAAGLSVDDEGEKASAVKLTYEEMEALFSLSRDLNTAHGREELLEIFAGGLQKIVPGETIAITLTSPRTGDNVVMHAAGQHAALLKGRIIPLGEGVTGWAIANRKPFRNADPKLDFSSLAEHFANYRTAAVCPIIKDGDLLGAVSLYSSQLSEYTAEHLRLFEEAIKLLPDALARTTSSSAPARPGRELSLLGDAPADAIQTSTALH